MIAGLLNDMLRVRTSLSGVVVEIFSLFHLELGLIVYLDLLFPLGLRLGLDA